MNDFDHPDFGGYETVIFASEESVVYLGQPLSL